MEPSHKFFANRSCAYYPCHDFPDVNCLFCYCPLYHLDCGGEFAILDNGLKDCSRCRLPHGPDGWDRVMARLKAR
jgi:Zn-finger protein